MINMTLSGKKKADLFLVANLLEKILSYAGDAGQCGEFITTQIRKMIGVKIVALIQDTVNQDTRYQMTSVCPPRRSDMIMRKEIFDLCRLSRNMPSAELITPDAHGHEGANALASLGFGDSFVVPLRAGAEHVGTLLLLDILDIKGVESIVRILESLSGVIGLIFKNSIFYHELDLQVKKRTLQLEKEIAERIKLEEKLKLMATTDHLTGILNRRAFEDVFTRERNMACRYNEPLSLVFLDIDHFKKVNDTYGHDVGDQVLQEVVKISMEQIRQVDTLARWGGEEFILIMPKTSLRVAKIIAERLRSAVENHRFTIPSKITLSLGVSQFHQSDSEDTLIKRADTALSQAKESGRNRVAAIPFVL